MDIFISYRRQDTSGYALGLRREFTQALPEARVFLDVEAIDAGVRWRDVIRERVERCDVMLVVIGDEWLVTRDGRRKIDLEDDPVRFELAAGLNRSSMCVLPLLVEEASMPPPRSLPEEVRALCEFNAHSIHDRTYDQDVNALVERLRALSEKTVPRERQDVPKPAGPAPPSGVADQGYPSKITERWLREEVSGMGRDALLALIAELFRRGWAAEDVYEYALASSPLTPGKRLPARISTLWLATNVPLLSPARLAKLVAELHARGWSDLDVRVHVYSNRQPGIAFGLPHQIRASYVERNAPLMTADEQDRLAAALVDRGWSGADIRAHMPYAIIPAS